MTRKLIVDAGERIVSAAATAFAAAALVGREIDWQSGLVAAVAAAVETVRSIIASRTAGTISPASFVKDTSNG